MGTFRVGDGDTQQMIGWLRAPVSYWDVSR